MHSINHYGSTDGSTLDDPNDLAPSFFDEIREAASHQDWSGAAIHPAATQICVQLQEVSGRVPSEHEQEHALTEALSLLGYDLAIHPESAQFRPIPFGYRVVAFRASPASGMMWQPQERSLVPEGPPVWHAFVRQETTIRFATWDEAWYFCHRYAAWVAEDRPMLKYLLSWRLSRPVCQYAEGILAISGDDATIRLARLLLDEHRIELNQLMDLEISVEQHLSTAEGDGLVKRAVNESGTQVQQVSLWCAPDRQMVTALADEAERHLTALGSPATVLSYGITPKQQQGYIVVEAAQGVPLAFYSWLQEEPSITDYSVYDVPCFEQELAAWDTTEEVEPEYVPEEEPFEAPALPAGYTAQSKPRPLYGSHDTYWIVWAWGESEDAAGLLLFDECGTYRAFFTAEEATTLLYTLLNRAAGDLLPQCSDEYLARHAPGVVLLQTHLWALQLEIMRRGFEISQSHLRDGSEQKQPPSEETPASLRRLFERLDQYHLHIELDPKMGAVRLVSDTSEEGGI